MGFGQNHFLFLGNRPNNQEIYQKLVLTVDLFSFGHKIQNEMKAPGATLPRLTSKKNFEKV
jgi:hypothetical protein